MGKSKGRSKTSVNVELVRKDIKKFAKESAKNVSADQGHAELSPGTVHRASPLEQDMGTRQYKKMIHDHNKKNGHALDKLPFTFPKKKIVRTKEDRFFECPKCSSPLLGGPNTYFIICSKCKHAFNVNEESFHAPVGMFNRAADLLTKIKHS